MTVGAENGLSEELAYPHVGLLTGLNMPTARVRGPTNPSVDGKSRQVQKLRLLVQLMLSALMQVHEDFQPLRAAQC